MGCGSRAGKMEMHNATSPFILQDQCIGCHACERDCAHGAISFPEKKAFIDESKCVGCGRCIGVCPVDAVANHCDESNDILNKKIAEYTLDRAQGTPPLPRQPCSGRISILRLPRRKMTCHRAECGHVRILRSGCLDMACADAVNRQPVMAGSVLSEREHCHHDHLQTCTLKPTGWWH